VDFTGFYERKNYKLYMLVPAAFFLAFLFLIFVWPTVLRGIDLQGGTLILVRSEKQIDSVELKQLLSQNFDLIDLKVNSISGPSGFGVNVQFAGNASLLQAESMLEDAESLLASDPSAARQAALEAVALISSFLEESSLSQDPQEAVDQAKAYLVEANKNINQGMQQMITEHFSLGEQVAFQRKEISPTLGSSFWQTAFNVAIVAGILIILVIFLFFRKVIPSLAVIAAAIFDVSGALALMAVFGIPLSLSSIPALLMLVGYSVDTDIMLTTRVLQRREKTPAQRASDSMATGLTMTGTTIAALISMILVSYLNQMFVIFEIAAVILFGLLADIVSTWLMNAEILLWYVERQQKKRGF
jgi:preprotein translocase subunit SecF